MIKMSHGCLNGWQSIKIHAKCNVNLWNGITNGDKPLSSETLTRGRTPIFIQRAFLRQRKTLPTTKQWNHSEMYAPFENVSLAAARSIDCSPGLYCSRGFKGFWPTHRPADFSNCRIEHQSRPSS